MKNNLLSLLIFLTSTTTTYSQIKPIATFSRDSIMIDSSRAFDINQWQRTFNMSFAKILGSVGTNNNVGNFASFDPAQGAYKFKGTIPVGNIDEKIRFFSLSLEGELLSDNISKVLEKAKLNTNTSIQGEYHFNMKIHEDNIIRDASSETLYNQEVLLANKKALYELKNFPEQLENSKRYLVGVKKELEVNFLQSRGISLKLDDARDSISKYTTLLDNSDDRKIFLPALDSITKYTKNYNELINKYKENEIKYVDNLYKIDSLVYTIDNWDLLSQSIQNKFVTVAQEKVNQLNDNYKFVKYQISWFTILGAIGKKKYHSYDLSLPFLQQIKENDLTTHRYGIAWSSYTRNDLKKRSLMLNIGIINSFDNNANELSTTDINQEIVSKNSLGDTTRKVINKYSAYNPNKLEKGHTLIPYINFYFLDNKNNIGMHVFTSYNQPVKKDGYMNFGFGFLASFNNIKKESPIINLEAYFQIVDLFNSKGLDDNIFERNEIGLRFTLPFNFF